MPVYKDNHCNRIAGRVGKTYGYEQKAEVAKKVSVAKTPSQAKVIAPKAKRTPMTAVKMVRIHPAAKDASIKGAEKNRLRIQKEAEEIANSKKPKVIKKKVIKKTPKTQDIKSITFEDVIDSKHVQDTEDEDSNYIDSMNYNNDFTDVLTPKQSRWYVKYRSEEDLSEKQEDIRESLQQKILEGVSNNLGNQRNKIFKNWKKANKGMTGTLEDFEKSFGKFYESRMS